MTNRNDHAGTGTSIPAVYSTVTRFWVVLCVGLLAGISCSQMEPLVQDGVLDIREFGAAGDGETDDTEIFRRAIEEIGDEEARIEITGSRFLVEGIEFPSNITLSFRNSGMLHVPADGAIRIDGAVQAGITEIFSGEGSVTGRIDNLHVYPQWFGARGDGMHDDSPALQRAADLAAEALGKTLFIPDGEYLFENDIVLRANVENRGLLVKEIEIDEDRTQFSSFTFVPTHYPKNNPHVIFSPDHEEVELDSDYFLGIEEGEFEVPVYREVPLADGSGQLDLAEGGTLRFYSSDFFSSRNNQKGDQYYDKNDMAQVVSGLGDVFPEFAFSYPEPPDAAAWDPGAVYSKGDYVSYGGEVFKATWTSGEGTVFEDRFLGTVEVGPVRPRPEEGTTRYDFVFDDGSEDAMNIWRRVETGVWYREKDQPLTVNGLRIEVRLKNNDGESKRISAGAMTMNRSNITFNNLEITVRDREATLGRLLNSRQAVNAEFNNGYFSGATYHGLGYNILNSNVANFRYNDCISTNSRKGLDGRHGKNISIKGGFYNVINDHYGRNYIIRDVVMSGKSTDLPGYVTPDADLQEWGFRTARPFSFSGANVHIENVTVNAGSGGILSARGDIGDLYGKIVLRDVVVRRNEGDVAVVDHSINPDFDFAGDVRVPDIMIIDNVTLENPGRLTLNAGEGFEGGTYGPVSVRNSGPFGGIYSASSSLTFSGCLLEDTEFETEPGSWVTIRNCTLSGTVTGLDEDNLGSATGNIRTEGAEAGFPMEYRGGQADSDE